MTNTVAPSNMGKGLYYSDGDKAWQVKLGDGLTFDDEGNIALHVATTPSDNQIEIRDGQVYMGNTAVQTDYYVDSNSGSDSTGDGTESNPFQSLTHVFSLLESRYAYTIHLQEEGEYTWSSSDSRALLDIGIMPYGPSWTSALALNFGADIAAMTSLAKRPTVNLVADAQNVYGATTYLVPQLFVQTDNTAKLNLWALHLVAKGNTTGLPIHPQVDSYFGSTNYEDYVFRSHGCTCTLADDIRIINCVTNVMFANLKLNDVSGNGLFCKFTSVKMSNFISSFQIDTETAIVNGATSANYRVVDSATTIKAKLENVNVISQNVFATGI